MKKIVFGITSLDIGGAERVLVDIANKLQEKYDITIFTLYGKGAFEKELNQNIRIIHLFENSYKELSGLKRKIIPLKVLKCGKAIYKKYIEGKFDLQIAFLEGPITRIFSNGKDIKKIVWIHNDLSKVFGTGFKAKIKLKLDKKTYSKYNKIIFVSNDNRLDFNNMYKITNIEEKEDVIYNYIDKDRILEKSNEKIEKNCIDKSTISIVTLSRLVHQKAIDRLIRVHKRLIEEGLIHKIYVIGDGPEKENLEKLIHDLRIENTFILLGKKENPYPYVKEADYLALLSYFEGYPMSLEEGKILNKKILLTNTASIEVVKDYKKKYIIENDEESIFNSLKKILNEEIILDDNKEEAYNNTYLIEKIEKVCAF